MITKIYCQISGCSPTPGINSYYDSYVVPYLRRLEETQRKEAVKMKEALSLLLSEDEKEGQRAIFVIGPFCNRGVPLWSDQVFPSSLYELLERAADRVRVISGCSVGNSCFIPNSNGDWDQIFVSFGCYFFVYTHMLPILDAVTDGRVSPRRLWELVMVNRHISKRDYRLRGVNYGPIMEPSYCPWYLGNIKFSQLYEMGEIGASEEIAKVLRQEGFWVWMRPDRFPINSPPKSNSASNISINPAANLILSEPISRLPLEILQSITLYLSLSDIVTLAMLNKRLYHQLLGNREARNATAKAYIRTQARWCLPYGEAELKWWNDRNGDDALGWSYLKRCLSESHSMRNRRRVWRAAQSIEQECELEESKRFSA